MPTSLVGLPCCLEDLLLAGARDYKACMKRAEEQAARENESGLAARQTTEVEGGTLYEIWKYWQNTSKVHA